MLYIDSLGQIRVGVSERIWIIRFKKVIYKQKKFSRKFWDPKIFKNRPPDHVSGWFLYQTDSK